MISYSYNGDAWEKNFTDEFSFTPNQFCEGITFIKVGEDHLNCQTLDEKLGHQVSNAKMQPSSAFLPEIHWENFPFKQNKYNLELEMVGTWLQCDGEWRELVAISLFVFCSLENMFEHYADLSLDVWPGHLPFSRKQKCH
jgi:hypothetical protein